MYSGEFEWNEILYQGKYEPLISKELWAKVQSILEYRYGAKTRKTKYDFTYTGLLTCGHCGCALVAEIKKCKYIYYHCTGYKGKCPEAYTREENLDKQLKGSLKRISLKEDVLEWMKTALQRSHIDKKTVSR